MCEGTLSRTSCRKEAGRTLPVTLEAAGQYTQLQAACFFQGPPKPEPQPSSNLRKRTRRQPNSRPTSAIAALSAVSPRSMSSSLSLSWSDSSTACCPRWAVISCRFSPDDTTGSRQQTAQESIQGGATEDMCGTAQAAAGTVSCSQAWRLTHTHTQKPTPGASRPSVPYLLQCTQPDSKT